MLTMETAGSWFDMGKQLGETFSHELKRCVDRFVGLIETHRTDTDATASAVRQQVEKYSPHLLEETAGMAEGSGIPELRLFKHRFYGNVMSLAPTGCSAFFVLDDESQSWLARSCDIEEEDHWCQICQVHRPADRYATATTSYLGFAGNVGINEHGLGIVGVSASTRETYGDAGIPSALLLDRALGSCRTLEEANEMLLAQPVTGKGQVWLAADASGASSLYQVAPGRCLKPLPRAEGRRWQACTNFQPTAEIPSDENPLGMYNSYARYGVMAHKLGARQAAYTQDGLQDVLRQISQPGPYIPKGSFPLETAYVSLFNLTTLSVHVAGGNPNTTAFREIPFA